MKTVGALAVVTAIARQADNGEEYTVGKPQLLKPQPRVLDSSKYNDEYNEKTTVTETEKITVNIETETTTVTVKIQTQTLKNYSGGLFISKFQTVR